MASREGLEAQVVCVLIQHQNQSLEDPNIKGAWLSGFFLVDEDIMERLKITASCV